MTLRPADRLPDLTLTDTRGRAVPLAALGGEQTLVIFLRHLACLPCREHLVEVLNSRAELGVRVAVIAFAAPESLAAYQQRQGLDDVLVLSDPERSAYNAFGFGRGSVARVWLDPRVWRRYAQLLRRGRRLEPAHEDTLQLGGDVLIGPDGRIRWVYESRGPDDRPCVATIRAGLAGRESPHS
jgi:peroxiredoxin